MVTQWKDCGGDWRPKICAHPYPTPTPTQASFYVYPETHSTGSSAASEKQILRPANSFRLLGLQANRRAPKVPVSRTHVVTHIEPLPWNHAQNGTGLAHRGLTSPQEKGRSQVQSRRETPLRPCTCESDSVWVELG